MSIHGHSRARAGGRPTLTYGSWKDMRKRCNNPKHIRYASYGGRGIKVCERWNYFLNFLSDMGEAPPGHSIERIDNNKGYEPGNCKWIPKPDQGKNRPGFTYAVTFQGKTQTYADWSRELGLRPNTICMRLKYGWSIEKTLSTPSQRRS